MKNYILSLFLITHALYANSVQAGGGGISGSPAKYIMVQICEGESGEQCRMARIKNRFTEQDHMNAINQKSECLIYVGEATVLPCSDDLKYGIPKFLQKINDAFDPSGAVNAPN